MCGDDIKLRIQGLLERCRKHSGLFWTATEGNLKEILVMSKAPGATDESISDLLRPYERGIATFEDVAGLPVVNTDLESEIDSYVGYPAGDPDEDLGTTRVREAARYFAEWGRKHSVSTPVSSDYEEIAPSMKEPKIINGGIWISWDDLWRIDGVAVRNSQRALESGDITLFQGFVGQRMLIEDLAKLIKDD